MQRVIAPRRPTDIITTSSWRTGQQTVKRILGPATKKTKTSAGSRPQSSSSQDTDVSEPKSLNFLWKDDDGNKRGGGHVNRDAGEKNGITKADVSRETSPVHEEQMMNGLKKDSGEVGHLRKTHAKGVYFMLCYNNLLWILQVTLVLF